MIRCNNCGWFNPDTATHCEMCEEELTGLPIENPAVQASEKEQEPVKEQATEPVHPPVPPVANPMLETVRFAPAGHDSAKPKPSFSATVMDATSLVKEDEPVHCPKCRYPIFGYAEVCPNCGSSLKNVMKETVIPVSPALTVKDTVEEKDPSQAPASVLKGTVMEKAPQASTAGKPERRAPRATVREIPSDLISSDPAEEVWRMIPVESPDTEIIILRPGEIVAIGNRRYKIQK